MVLLLSLVEVLLLGLVIFFFWRLRQSEAILSQLQNKQDDLLNKLRFNAQLEQELMASFTKRQAELTSLDEQLAERTETLQKLLNQAQEYARSPQFLRETILNGHRQGKNARELAKVTGLSLEEVELIIEQGTH
jgi:uncharacterized protein HemX